MPRGPCRSFCESFVVCDNFVFQAPEDILWEYHSTQPLAKALRRAGLWLLFLLALGVTYLILENVRAKLVDNEEL